jgi:hypothetical protein
VNAPWLGLFALGLATTVFAQPPAAPAAGAAQDAASGSSKDEPRSGAGGRGQQTQKSGEASRRANRKPMDIRLYDGAVKLPKCTTESREGMDCEK